MVYTDAIYLVQMIVVLLVMMIIGIHCLQKQHGVVIKCIGIHLEWLVTFYP